MGLDVLFVGAGPAGLVGAIELARLVQQDNAAGGGLGDVEIGVLEKAAALGEHSLSGAVINPRVLREMFPDLTDADLPLRARVEREAVYLLTASRRFRLPTPPTMRNRGNYVASLCEVVRWLGERAEALGVNVFTGFPAAALLVDGQRVAGVRTAASGLGRDGEPGDGYMAPNDITAKVIALAEGSRGALTQAFFQWQNIPSSCPQVYSLGVKEIWETKRPLDRVIHTLGWPLPRDTFGGSFLYPLEPHLVAIGLVAALDSPDGGLDVHARLQAMKEHHLFRHYLRGGEMVEWGAKTIPEGGYHALANRRHGDGVVVLGDAAGLVDVPSLKGIHYAMQSGVYAARVIFQALKAGDTSAATLGEYDRLLNHSYVVSDLHRTRNMRPAFKDGFWIGGIKAALMSATRGRFPGRSIYLPADAAVPRRPARRSAATAFVPDGTLTFSKVDGVFRSGNTTRDTIPQHLLVGPDIPPEVAEFYASVCPAGVYERVGDQLRVNAPNCVDCKATDVVGPRWMPREGGSGPKYQRM